MEKIVEFQDANGVIHYGRRTPKPRKREIGRKFFMLMFANPIHHKLMTTRLPGATMSVYAFVTAYAERDNLIDVTLERVAALCNMDKPQASRALKQLEELDVLVTFKEGPGKRRTMINPAIGWNGTEAALIRGRELWAMRCHAAAQEAKAKAKAKEEKAKRAPLKLVEAA